MLREMARVTKISKAVAPANTSPGVYGPPYKLPGPGSPLPQRCLAAPSTTHQLSHSSLTDSTWSKSLDRHSSIRHRAGIPYWMPLSCGLLPDRGALSTFGMCSSPPLTD